jgi:hypothetical protein
LGELEEKKEEEKEMEKVEMEKEEEEDALVRSLPKVQSRRRPGPQH